MIDELMTQDEAEAFLRPHLPAIRGFIQDGWQTWIELVTKNPELVGSAKRTRANIVYDQIAQKAEAYFDSEGVPTSTDKQFLIVSLAEGRLELRFKKFKDSQMHTSGIPTAQMLEIEAQQVVIDGMAVTYLIAGYLPDSLGVGLDNISIVCSYNQDVIWQIDLLDGGAGAVIPVVTNDPQGPTVRSTRPAASEEQAES